MFSTKVRNLIAALRSTANGHYATEDDMNNAVMGVVGQLNDTVIGDRRDIDMATKAYERHMAEVNSAPDGEPFVAPSLMQSEDELDAEAADQPNPAPPSRAEVLREILASVEEECYKVEITPDGVFVVTYNAKVAVAACLDPVMADTLANLLNSTGQTPAKNT